MPITIAVTPDTGPSTRNDTQIDMNTGNPAQTTVNITLPAGATSSINAWTR